MATLIIPLLDRAASGDLKALGVLGQTLFCAYAGTRLKEVRLANRGDYSITHYELTIYHPKGEGAWGVPRKTVIVPPGRQLVDDFMAIRSNALKKRGIVDSKSVPLVPYFRRDGQVIHWPDSILHNVKCEVEREYGLQFDFRMLRRSFGQAALDRNARLDSVSSLLGHKTTRTTEVFYARRKVEHAIEDIVRVYTVPQGLSIPADWPTASHSE